MVSKERFCNLPDYPFSKLRNLLGKVNPLEEPLDFSVGEPKHPVPPFVKKEIAKYVDQLNRYPPNFGSEKLLESISSWLANRYEINSPSPDKNLVALNGSREGIFNATIALCNYKRGGEKPVILIPNPFYQCYLAAALAADAEPVFVPALPSNHFLPDFSKLSPKILNRTSILIICSPSNPQGAVADLSYWKSLLNLAELYGFKIFSDECYSEIYRDVKPVGLLQASIALDHDPEKSLSFNSLSKRSNLPGLRSGFVWGGQKAINSIKKLRSYGGAPLPIPVQEVSKMAWNDEKHVELNRHLYREKYKIADRIFKSLESYKPPEAGFFLWLKVGNGEKITFSLWKNYGIKCLPGSYLTNQDKSHLDSDDPGGDFIRVALVHSIEKTTIGLMKIAKDLKLKTEEEIESYVSH
tara:strand:+ start:499 stop:1731 length:1233 start_codon:yes stop_codon:yes gene_type:complete